MMKQIAQNKLILMKANILLLTKLNNNQHKKILKKVQEINGQIN